VQDGKIVAAGSKVAEPTGAEVIDVGNATLLPGLMDAHTHMTSEATGDWKKDELDHFKKPIPQFAIEGDRLCAAHADGRVHHRARPRSGRPHRHRAAQRDQ